MHRASSSAFFPTLAAVTLALGACRGEPEPAPGASRVSASPEARSPEPEARTGSIFAISEGDPGGRATWRLGATFTERAGKASPRPRQDFGPCYVETVLAEEAAAEEEARSAGALQLAGGTRAVELTPEPDGAYSPVGSSTADLFRGGESLGVSAQGGEVPAFSLALVAPSRLLLESPVLPAAGAALVVRRDAPLTLAWRGASSGTVVAYLAVARAERAFTLTCAWPPGAGEAEVPAAALDALPAGLGTFDVYVKENARTKAGGWSIGFTASTALVTGAGALATGDVELR